MKPALLTALGAALLLAACGGKSSSHATCIDITSTSKYMGQFADDRAAAKASGKITKEQADQSEMDQLYFKDDPNDEGALCNFADAQRKKLGI